MVSSIAVDACIQIIDNLYFGESAANGIFASVAECVCSDAEVLARHAHLAFLIGTGEEADCVKSHF